MGPFLDFNLRNDIMIIAILAGVSFALFFLVCRPVAWHLILHRNRYLSEDAPAGTIIQPRARDLLAVAACIFTLVYSIVIIGIMIWRFDVELCREIWHRVLSGSATTLDSAGLGAVTGISLMSAWAMFSSLRWLLRTRGQVDWILPVPDTSLMTGRVPRTVPHLRSID